MKIIFLIDSTFSKRDYDRFGCDIFYKHKVDLCLWDFRKINLREDSSDSYEKNIDLTRFKALSNFNELHTNNNLVNRFVVNICLQQYHIKTFTIITEVYIFTLYNNNNKNKSPQTRKHYEFKNS